MGIELILENRSCNLNFLGVLLNRSSSVTTIVTVNVIRRLFLKIRTACHGDVSISDKVIPHSYYFPGIHYLVVTDAGFDVLTIM